MIIESDFYATEAGRQHFADQLTSIRYCVQETCNFDAIYAYLTCGNYDFNYDRMKNLRPRRNIKTAMNHEIMMYAICQKEEMGFDKAVEECKFRMSRYGVTPNMLVVPPQLLLYLSLAPEAKLTYKEGGPNAEARFEAGVAGYEARAFRGCGVFTSEPFEVSDDSDAVQMLTRNTQVGEFYYMHPPKNVTGAWKPGMCNMILYDEEADKHVTITWDQAMQATMVADNGSVDGTFPSTATPPNMSGPTAAKTTKDWYDLANAWNQLNRGIKISALASAGIAADSADPPSQDQMNAAYKALSNATNEVPYIAVTRPFIEHMMHSVILTVAGRDTGATLFGPSDMQLSANTQVKTIEGHYTGHFKAVITKPQNVLVMRDVAAAGYVAGGNCLFFAGEKGTYSASTCKENLAKRLAFSDDVGAKYRSMLSFPMFESQLDDSTTCLDTVMSVTSRLLPWEVQGTVANGNHTSFPGGVAVFKLYNSLLGLRSIHFGEDMKAAENQDFISQGSTNNALCFVGPHRKYDAFTNSYYSLTPGQGHWGPDAIPGDARWRRGESVSLKAARNSLVSLEVAAHAQMAFTKA